MSVEDPRVRMVEDRSLDAPSHERLRLTHEELVERVLGGDEHGEPVRTSPGAAPLLAQACHRPREADRDRAVEEPDVDSQLEGVGRGDAEELTLDESPLDLAPLRRCVARPVGGESCGRGLVEPFGGEAMHELGCAPALGEADRAQVAADELGEDPRGLAERARPHPQLLVEERRVPEGDGPLGARRRVVGDDRDVQAEEGRRLLAGICDRGRGEQELRLCAVDLGRAAEPPQHVPTCDPKTPRYTCASSTTT